MLTTKYLLIGGGLSSNRAARILSMKDPGAPVTLVCKEPHLPYDRPPLSKEFLRGEKTRAQITYDPPAFFEERNIRAITGDPVVQLDIARSQARLESGGSIRFDKALIATGGEPIRLGVPGSSLAGIHYLRSMEDAEVIRSEAAPGKRAVVIGAGFIGMELAASLTTLGVRVTVVEALSHVWARFLDRGLADYVRRHCEEKGIVFLTGEKVSEFHGDGHVRTVATQSGSEIECDFVCVGVGIRPQVEFALSAGLEVQDGIVVDERFETSHPDIFAAGDVASFPDPVSGKRRRVEHWGHAEASGQVAALSMAGHEQAYDFLSYAWSDVFDLHIEFAGDESGRDQVIVRGAPESGSFTVLYLAGGVLAAYLAVNTRSREFPKLQKLIRRKTPLAGREGDLADPGFDLKTLIA